MKIFGVDFIDYKKPFVYSVGWSWAIKFPDYYFPIIVHKCSDVKERINQWILAGPKK